MTPLLGRRGALGAAAALGLPGVLPGVLPGGLRAQPAPRPSPPAAPMLLPETGGHLGAVRSVSVSPDGGTVATGGLDRSIRLWDGATGHPLAAWRPPLDDGNAGIVDGVRFSSDGQYLLVTAVDWVGDRRGILYVFHARTGAVVRYGAGVPDRMLDLAVSPGGGHVALAAANTGLLVLATGPGMALSMLADARGAAGPVVAAAFSPDGRVLASAAKGGAVRLQAVGATLAELAAPRQGLGGTPVSLAFSPDGRRLAAGFSDRRGVAVLDLASGAATMLEPPASLGPGNLAAVAWARDGEGAEWLFAGGMVQQAGANVVLAWRGGRAGTPLLAPVARDSIADVQAHPLGGVMYGSSDASWGRVQVGRGRLDVSARPAARLDFREVPRRRWGLDPSGRVVEFQGLRAGQPALRFDLGALRLDEGARPAGPELRRPPPNPAIRLPPGTLERGERLLSADAGGGRAVAGTDESLWLLDGSGRTVARRSIASAAWGVAVTPDGRLAVAAHGDGTVRWYGLSPAAPLAELGGLLVHGRGVWVAWRSDGRFAYSELGGQSLVGLHQNGRVEAGQNAALTSRWFAVDQAYRRLHDPDAVRAMADRGGADRDRPDGDRADGAGRAGPLLPAAASLPSLRVVQVCATATGCVDLGDAPVRASQEVQLPPGTMAARVRLDLGPAQGPVLVDAFVNGINMGRMRHPPGQPVERTVPLPPGDARIEFRAYGAADAFTRTPAVVIRRDRPAPAPGVGRMRVLAVGINDYSGSIGPLRFAVADAEMFAATLRRTLPRAYAGWAPPVLLRDGEATLEGVRNALAALAADAQPDDAVMVYLSGHGVAVGGAYAFVPVDVRDADAALERGEGCLLSDQLVALLSEIRATRTFLLLDTCFAGAFDLQGGGRLGHESGRFVLAASGRRELALDGYDGRNGVFAYAVKEALTTLPPSRGGVLDAIEFGRYVRDEVQALARSRNHVQSAIFKAAGDLVAFPVAQPA